MASEHFRVGMILRVSALLATALILASVAARTHWYVTMALLTAALLAQTGLLIRFATSWSRKVAHFLDAVALDDGSAIFPGMAGDSAFRELGTAMGRVTENLTRGRAEREQQSQYLKALINHVPVALIAVEVEGRVHLLNFAARRLFEGVCTTAKDFLRHGAAFAAGLENLSPGDGVILRMERASGALQLKAAATDLIVGGRRQRLISLQNVENELTSHEMAAWQSVMRVMAHEVMNSLTPVTSLAATAQSLIAQVAKDLPGDGASHAALSDAEEALEVLGRRSEGLLHFVQNHRRMTKRMVAKLEPVRIERTFARLKRLLASDLDERGLALLAVIEPATLEVNADPELLDQALINLLRNAMDALRGTPAGRITLFACRDDRQAILKVTDNGPGIPPEHREKVFVPFFTTKRQGSGVGLTLARQIAAVHGGTIALSETEGGGTTVTMRF